jgi:hypothetical protein
MMTVTLEDIVRIFKASEYASNKRYVAEFCSLAPMYFPATTCLGSLYEKLPVHDGEMR